MWVKPAPGLKVRSPETKQLLPDEGIEVPDDSILWGKLLSVGDVVRTTAPASESAASAGSNA